MPNPIPYAAPNDVHVVVNQAVTKALAREDVPIDNRDVYAAAPKVTGAVIAAIEASPTVAVVPVTPPWTSKINWTALITAGLTLGALFGLPLDEGQKADAAAAIVTVGSLATVIFKTFFTKSITSTSK